MIVITLTNGAYRLAKSIQEKMEVEIYHQPRPFKAQVGKLFKSHESLLFIMATGIVVRVIADFIEDKTTDPGVLVMDEKGDFVISLLSGHLGGANEQAIKLSKLLDCTPVITTASDVNKVLSIDMFAKKYKLILKDMEGAKRLTQQLVNGHLVQIVGLENISEKGYTYQSSSALVEISHQKIASHSVQLLPKNLVLGVGCRRGTSKEDLWAFIKESFKRNGLAVECISNIGSAWIKGDEKGLIDLSSDLNVPFVTFTKEEIEKVDHLFDGSDFVREQIGVSSVSMPCGYLASDCGILMMEKIKHKGMTLSIWEKKI